MVAIRGNQVEVRPSIGGPTEVKLVKHGKYILPADRHIKQITHFSAFRRKTTLSINPDKILDLYWSLADTYHTTNIGLIDSNAMLISTNCIDVDTLCYAREDKCKEWCGTSLKMNVTVLQSNREPIVCHAISSNEDTLKIN